MARTKFNPLEKKEYKESLVNENIVEAVCGSIVNKWENVNNEEVAGLVNALSNRYKKESQLTITVNGTIVVKR